MEVTLQGDITLQSKTPLTPISDLKDIWNYDPRTGVFRWKVHASRKCRAGTIAGSNKEARYGSCYIELCYKQERYLAHRVAWAFVNGDWPSLDIDHKNGDKADNRIANLRLATRSQNIAHKSVNAHSLTGVKGVYRDKRDGRFYPYLDTKHGRVALGGFASLDAAGKAREIAEKRYWKEFSWKR